MIRLGLQEKRSVSNGLEEEAWSVRSSGNSESKRERGTEGRTSISIPITRAL